MSLVSSVFPFSLAEALLLIGGLWLCVVLTKAVYRLVSERASLSRTLGSGILSATALGVSLAATGYLLWGLNYARPDAATRLGWKEKTFPDGEELARITAEAVNLANLNRAEAIGGTSLAGVDSAIDQGFARVGAALGLDPIFGRSLGPAKPIAASLALSYFGLSGFYFPWTGEANYNRLAPNPEKIHAIAHEKAHQRGVAGEDEANFFAFLACAYSSHPAVRYSGHLFAQRQLLRQLFRIDPEAAGRLARLRSPEVVGDEAAIRRFWRGFRGPAMRVGAAVNDSYLKFQGVPGGIQSYEESARLLVLFWRANGESLGGAAASH